MRYSAQEWEAMQKSWQEQQAIENFYSKRRYIPKWLWHLYVNRPYTGKPPSLLIAKKEN